MDTGKFLQMMDMFTTCMVVLITWVYICVHARSLQSCLTVSNHMDWNLPGSSVHGILQPRILKQIAMPSFRKPNLDGYISPNSQVLYINEVQFFIY